MWRSYLPGEILAAQANLNTELIVALLQDEVVELFFSFLESNLRSLNDVLHDKSSDDAETLLEDLYCASSVLGFNSIANRAMDLRGLVKGQSRRKFSAHTEFFFLKCEAQLARTEWNCHRRSSTIDRLVCQPTSLEDTFKLPPLRALSEESPFNSTVLSAEFFLMAHRCE